MLVRKGTEIVCAQGHKLGSVTEDILTWQKITAENLRINFSAADILPSNDGHSCRECGERVTELRGQTYRIHTAGGWVG